MSTAPKPQKAVQDPVKVDPKHYKVDIENEQVRVLGINYGAHEKSVIHSHPDGMATFQNDIHCRFTFPDGKTEERRFRAGEALYMPAGSRSGEPEQSAHRHNTRRTETVVRETSKGIQKGWCTGARVFVCPRRCETLEAPSRP